MMMLAVLVIGGGLGWYIAKAKRQAETVAAIRRIGGEVNYDWEYRNGESLGTNAKPLWPDWLIDTIGPDYLSNVTAVFASPELGMLEGESHAQGWMELDDALASRIGELLHVEWLFLSGNSRFTDAHLARFSGLDLLRKIDLGGTGVTGPGLAHFRTLTRLENANLIGLPIRDADLSSLSRLSGLNVLSFSGDQITDAGLAHLGTLKRLETLRILSTSIPSPITSKGLAHLSGLRQLKRLEISSTKIESLEPIRTLTGLQIIEFPENSLDDNALAPLTGFDSLEILILRANPKITDTGLAHLSGLKKLYLLDLDNTSITDAGVAQLARITGLEEIHLNGTKTTRDGIAALKAKFPRASIYP
jgi:Leucine-rich repeat (LRR) protein